ILDEVNAIMRQMSSDTNSQESENAIRDVLRSVRHVLAMDAFANTSTLTFLQVIMDKLVAFVSTRAVMARALMKKASKLSKPDNSPIRACAYYGDIDGKQRQKDFSNINIAWKLCSLIASTGTSLQLIKMDESREIIGNRKKVHNEVKVEALVVKETDFNAVAIFQNLIFEKAENLKFDQECSIIDTMTLKQF
ncbi:10604_t:CDS:2, partial [Funneliformis geosporum]